MTQALELAARARGRTSPNPMVGCVVVAGGAVVGQGHHVAAGAPHAEVVALAQAGSRARGATMYVTLEPCAHLGRTPPCTEAIVQAGVARVVLAVADPNPKAAGGAAYLRSKGVQVEIGLLEPSARALNCGFFSLMERGRPHVTYKYAMSWDGKVATHTGAARWVSGEQARVWAHRMRDQVDVVMVGAGTVAMDDPTLTTRLPESELVHLPEGRAKDAIRLVVSSKGRLDAKHRLFHVDSEAPTWVAVGAGCPEERQQALRQLGAQLLILPEQEGRVDLSALLAELGRRQLLQVLLEGGPTLAASMLRSGLIDRVSAVLAPKLIGGQGAPTPLGGVGVDRMEQAWLLGPWRCQEFGADLLLEADVQPKGGKPACSPV